MVLICGMRFCNIKQVYITKTTKNHTGIKNMIHLKTLDVKTKFIRVYYFMTK